MSSLHRWTQWFSLRHSNSSTMPTGISFDVLSIRTEKIESTIDWRLHVEARLNAGPTAARGRLMLDLTNCPLLLEEVTTSWPAIVERIVSHEGLPSLLLIPQAARKSGWNGAHLNMLMRWCPSDPVLHGLSVHKRDGTIAPCIVMPDMLPRLVSVDEPLLSPRGPLPVCLPLATPVGLGLAGVNQIDHARSTPNPMLQQIIFDRSQAHVIEDDTATVMFDSEVEGERANSTMLQRIKQLKEFIGAELNFTPKIRHLLYISKRTHPVIYAPTGSYFPVDPAWVGGVKPYTRKDASVVQHLTLGWLGGGVRLIGENSTELTLALGGALGLRWLEVHSPDRFTQTIASQQAALERSTDMVSRTPGQRLLALQLPLFAAMQRAGVAEAIGGILHRSWGSFLDQESLVTQLRQLDVPVPGVYM